MGFLLYVLSPSLLMAAISDYATDWSVDVLSGTPSYQFTITPPGQAESQVFKPNTLSRIGVGAAWRGYGFDITWANSQSAEQQQKRGSTANTDYSISMYWKMLAVDVYLQDYRGFYVENTSDDSGVYLQYRDAKAVHAGTTFYYTFSYDRYTMASAFQQTVKQTESGGSWILAGYLNTFSVDTGNYTANSLSGLAATYQAFSLSSTNIGTAGGYGYSLRSPSGAWYVSGQFLIGLGYQTGKYQPVGGAVQSGAAVSSKGTIHYGMGWTGERNCVGLVALMDSTSFGDGDKSGANSLKLFSSMAQTGRLFYLYRF